jgi:hypothetical protein
MKTIKFKGTEDQLINLKNAMDFSDNEMPKEVETRAYVADKFEHNTSTLTDEMFIVLTKEYGRVYNLEDFQYAFDSGEINSQIEAVRIIEVEV